MELDWAEPTLGEWAIDRMTVRPLSVVSLVPTGFEAYGRILHRVGMPNSEAAMRWSEVAELTGTVIHSYVQFQAIAGFLVSEGRVFPPDEGTLTVDEDLSQVVALQRLLADHTSTTSCIYAYWIGHGFMHHSRRLWPDRWSSEPPDIRAALDKVPDLVDSDQLLRQDDGAQIWESALLAGHTDDVVALAGALWQGPDMWWPDDRTWFVATHTDFNSTYIGGSRRLVADLCSNPVLEAIEVSPDDPITYDSDDVNEPGLNRP